MSPGRSSQQSPAQNPAKLQKQNQEMKKMIKTAILKLSVLNKNLGDAKDELGSDVDNENLNTSIAQVNALVESLRTGLESNLNWLTFKTSKDNN